MLLLLYELFYNKKNSRKKENMCQNISKTVIKLKISNEILSNVFYRIKSFLCLGLNDDFFVFFKLLLTLCLHRKKNWIALTIAHVNVIGAHREEICAEISSEFISIFSILTKRVSHGNFACDWSTIFDSITNANINVLLRQFLQPG